MPLALSHTPTLCHTHQRLFLSHPHTKICLILVVDWIKLEIYHLLYISHTPFTLYRTHTHVQVISSWQFVNSIKLWTRMLATYPGMYLYIRKCI